jgi:hypothetical protein
MRRQAFAPGLFFGFGGVVAGEEEWYVAGEPRAEAVAFVAGAFAADQALLRGKSKPARESWAL